MSSTSEFKCAKCGGDTELADPNPAETVCHKCCEDHNYVYDTIPGWAMCMHCNKPAPDDWFSDEPGNYF